MLHHACLTILPHYPWIEIFSSWWSPIRLIFVGRPAVILFFILSGFVLAISIEREMTWNYTIFAFRRICRIYIPAIAAIAFSATLYYIVHPVDIAHQTSWFKENWTEHLDFTKLLNQAFFLGRKQDASLNIVFWSLIIELRISLVFPALYFLSKHLSTSRSVFAMLIWIVGTETAVRLFGFDTLPYFSDSPSQAILAWCHFIPFFYFGAMLASHRETIKFELNRSSRLVFLLALAVALAAMTRVNDFIAGVGSGIIIALSLSDRAVLLEHKIFCWLGRISYSLYLVHVPIIFAMYYSLWQRLPPVLVIVLAVAVSICFAAVFHALVERPSQLLGKTRWPSSDRPQRV
ncbi:acyltransferase [Rhodopseudomonas sp. P2A-2r]|uniref:acyltransferase family protein n=1 Tax=Rhodopseudomonas sp. P2A-2r TaxID=2991972 RepID=UPI0022340D9A|nr:acyltransferase [Rhodopseudomonas sp. P2A-2r]UZE52277.1 acyltransferase [Rhodopseudomonas sp. P2A-2r]